MNSRDGWYTLWVYQCSRLTISFFFFWLPLTPFFLVLFFSYRSIYHIYNIWEKRTRKRGFAQDNIRKLKIIYNILRSSLEKTICYKENLTKKAFLLYKIYGKDVKINITKSNGTHLSLDFTCPRLSFTPNRFLFKEIKDPLREVR